MTQEKEYFAFISYKSEDAEWAIWLQHELEHYHLPTSFNGRTDIRQDLRPVFRDIDELSAGNLPSQIERALANSQNLIVVCSPRSAASTWVNEEVKTFISMNKTNQIFPFIVEGSSPHAVFPPALLNLPKKEERLGGDVSKNGKDAAFVKIVAGMLGVDYDSLWQRYEREKIEEQQRLIDTNNKIRGNLARFVSEKAHQLTEANAPFLAARITLAVLPNTNSSDTNSYPYVVEAERALREANGHTEQVLQHKSMLWYATLSPDEAKVASACEDHTVWVWDIRSGKCLHILEGHTGIIQQTAFSPDGKIIASASHDGTVRLWDAQTGQCLRILNGKGGQVFSVAFSPVGLLLASGAEDATIRLWDISSGKCTGMLTGHEHNVLSIMFSSDGKHIISSSADSTIRIWELNKRIIGKPKWASKKILRGHISGVWSARLNTEGTHIISASLDNTVRIWDSETGECLKVLNQKEIIDKGGKPYDFTQKGFQHATFSPNGKYVAAALHDKTIRIWDWCTEQCRIVLGPYKSFATSVFYTHDGNEIIVGAADSKVHIHTNLRRTFHHPKSLLGPTVVFLGNNRSLVSEGMYDLRIWDLRVDECIHVFQKSKFLLNKDKNLLILPYNSVPNYRILGHSYIDNSPLFFPEKNRLFLVCKFESSISMERESDNYVEDTNVYLFDFLSKKILQTFQGHEGFVSEAYLLSQGEKLLTSSIDKTVRLWDVYSGKCIYIFRGHNEEIIHMAISYDESTFASTDYGTIKIWDLQQRICIQTISDWKVSFRTVSLSPTGQFIAIATTNSISVYNVKAAECVWNISIPQIELSSVQFSSDGRMIVAGYKDGTIRIWDFLPLQEIIDESRERFKDYPLTPEERRKFYLE